MKAPSITKPEQSRHHGSSDRGGHDQGQQAMAVLDSRPEKEQQQGLLSLMAGSPRLQRKCACGNGAGATRSCLECQQKQALPLQTKLRINEPGDKYEQEADRIADQVMRMPEPSIQRQMEAVEDEEEGMVQRVIANQITPLVQRQVLPKMEEEKEGVIQTKTIGNQAAPSAHTQVSPEVPQSVHEVLSSCSGWESDCESFCIRAAKQYWIDVDGVHPPAVKGVECSTPFIDPDGKLTRGLCIVTYKGGLRVSIERPTRSKTLDIWRTRGSGYVGNTCTYEYHCTTKDNSLVLKQTSCSVPQPQVPQPEQDDSKESSPLQRYPAHQSELSQPPPIVHEVLNSPGQPLDPATSTFMESRFRHDFSHVRVHSDAAAVAAADAVNAKAFTVRNTIVFGAGQYAPASGEGRRLLAHELTHVVQQAASSSEPRRPRPSSSLPAQVAQRSPDRLFRDKEKTALEKENITDKRIVDDVADVQRIIVDTLSNPNSKLFPYIKGKLENLKGGKIEYNIVDPAVFAYQYKRYAKRRKVKIDPSVKDEDLVREIGGFYEPTAKGGAIYLKIRSNYCHAFHETIHSFSKPDILIVFLGKDLMEGLTQYFTDMVFDEQLRTSCQTHKYGPQLACATKLVDKAGFDGFDLVASLFFLSEIGKLDDIAKRLGLKNREELRQLSSDGICKKLSSPIL